MRAQLDDVRYDCAFLDLQTADLSGFDIVVPLTLRDYEGLGCQPADVRRRALFPRPDVVSLCHDKLRFNRAILATPHAWTIPPLFDAGSPVPPFVLKRREDEFGHHTHLVRTVEDEAKVAHLMTRAAFFAQAYVPGVREYATHILIRNGVRRYHLNVVYEMGEAYYVKNNAFPQKRIHLDQTEDHLPLFMEILAAIGYADGTCCFNYKLEDGRPRIFELNPRFGGSLNRGLNDYLAAYAAALSG